MQKTLWLFFLCCFLTISAQEHTISGSIVNLDDEQPIAFANITISDSNEKNIAHTQSNTHGEFNLKIPSDLKQVTINITAFGYVEITLKTNVETSKALTIALEKNIDLKEVVIVARAAGDVLNLDLEDMNLSKNATLRDILNKTDGVLVSKDGAITFLGKQINKILINRKEVFVNQNKVALDNLNYELMDTLQIVSNYKDRFTLDLNKQDETVINIKTKSKFKGVFKTQIDGSYGIKNAYNVNAKGFFFSDILNAFITTNANNVGHKELSQRDVSSSVSDYASSWMNTTLNPFFMEDYQVSKNFVNHNSLTLRWEDRKSKLGLVTNQGYMDLKRAITTNTSVGEDLLRNGSRQNSERGHFLSTTFNYDQMISTHTALKNVLSVLTVQHRFRQAISDTVYTPQQQSFVENTQQKPQNTALLNSLSWTRSLNKKSMLDLKVNAYYENGEKKIETELVNYHLPPLFLTEDFTKGYLSVYGNHQWLIKKSVFNSGIRYTYTNEKANLDLINTTTSNQLLKRSVGLLELPLRFNGTKRKIEYRLLASPSLFLTERIPHKRFFKTTNRLTYYFEPQNELSLRYNRDFRFHELRSMYNHVMASYNLQTHSSFLDLGEFATTNQTSLTWEYNNVPKNQYLKLSYGFKRELNAMQHVLDSIQTTTFYYSNQLFDKNDFHTADLVYSKGVYLGSAYHYLRGAINLKYTTHRYASLIDQIEVMNAVNRWVPSLNVNFKPREWFFKDIESRIEWDNSFFKMDGNEVNHQKVFTNTWTLRGHDQKIDWQMEFVYQLYNVYAQRFNVPDLHLSLKYDVRENLAFTLSGRSLLTLFDLNRYNYVNTQTDGNTLRQTTTKNNLGYLMVNVSLKM